MGVHTIDIAGAPVEVLVRRSKKARRISLRVSGLDGRVTLTLPQRVAEAEGTDFVRSKTDWIARQLGRVHRPEAPQIGGSVMVQGQLRRIVAGQVRRPVLDGDLIVPAQRDKVAARVAGFLKTQARDALTEASDRYAAQLGRSYGKITLRDTRSRWGSCSARGDLMYSWRLIMAPSEVLDYVAAHEVAHLAEMNHSPAFWAHVGRLYPGYDTPRQWLRQHGTSLHRYQF